MSVLAITDSRVAVMKNLVISHFKENFLQMFPSLQWPSGAFAAVVYSLLSVSKALLSFTPLVRELELFPLFKVISHSKKN